MTTIPFPLVTDEVSNYKRQMIQVLRDLQKDLCCIKTLDIREHYFQLVQDVVANIEEMQRVTTRKSFEELFVKNEQLIKDFGEHPQTIKTAYFT